MPSNFYILFLTALIPMVIGAAYYHPKVVGTAWMKSNGFTPESLEGANMGVIMGLSYVLSVILSFGLIGMVIHQTAIYSLFVPEVMDSTTAISKEFGDLMTKYGDRHRGFSHGVVHGLVLTLFTILPVMAINAMFERRGWRYILIHVGYWAISLMLIGGILSATLKFDL